MSRPIFCQFVLSYTVEYEIAGDGITVSVDFQNIAQNGVDFGETAILSAVDEGVALNIAQLEAGLADDTLADALNINYTANVNGDSAWDAYEVVSADPGLEVADGEIRVTADGTVVLSDGVSTINIVITGYQATVQKVLGDGATIEALGDTELPMGASAAYEDISDKAEALAETYNLIPEQTEEEKKEIGFSAFDVAVTVPSDDYVAEGSFAVTVPHAIDVEVPENAKVTYELFHIHEVDGEMKAELVENATVEDGKVSFVTDGFPEYVVVYTVNSDSTKKQFTANYDTEISEATKLSAVLDALSIVLPAESGSAIAVTDIDRIESEDDIKLAVRSDGNDWTITPTAAFDSLALKLKLKDDKGSVTINVKSRIKVTVTANTFSKTYGEDDPTFTATVTGLPDGVDESVISYSLTRSEGDNVGTYDITPVGDAEQGDYVINYVGGTLEINPAPVTLTANSDTKPKTGEEIIVESFTCSVNNLIFGEGVTASGRGTEPGMYDVTFEGVTLNETKDTTGNYVVTATQNGLLIITDGDGSNLIKKELTGFNGDLASYKIEINPGKLILNDGEPITIKDTFSNNQSINYGSVKVNISNAETDPSFDYSGYTGTFTVPDGNAVTITYTTRVKGNVGDAVDISNTATLGRVTNRDYASGPSATVSNKVTITPTGSDTSGTDGVYTIRLFAYAEGHMERGLKGAAFRLLDSNMRPMVYKAGAHKGEPIVFTTNDNGYADIALDEAKDGLTIRKNTVYYLEMTAAPFELLGGEYIYYQKDNTYYSFLITDEPSYEYGNIYSYFNGDVLKVRCCPEAGGVNVTKRFSGNYELTEDQKNAITFTLQKQNGKGWKDVERHAYGEFSYGSVNFDIKVSDLEDGAIYRMVETNALPDELEGIVELNATSSVTYQVEGEPVEDESGVFLVDPDDKTQVSYSFTFTNEYVDHKLTVIKIDGDTGKALPGAVFTVYDTQDSPVATYEAGNDNSITIRRGDAGAEYAADTLYYVVETKAPEGYVIPASPEKIYFYFSESESGVPEGLPDGASATDLTTSYNTVTLPNRSEKVDIPVTVTWGVNGDEAWPEAVNRAVVGLYKSVGGAASEAVTKNDQPLTLELKRDQYYDTTTFVDLPAQEDGKDIVYSVVEKCLYNANGEDVKDTYARNTIVSGTGWYVINHQPAVSVTVKKTWVQNDGTTKVSDTSGYPDVTFALYRLTTDENMNNMEREDLLQLLGSAAPVRTGLSLSYESNWTQTVNGLEEKDSAGNPWYYYALEDVPDNQIDTYSVSADPRVLTIQNQQAPSTVTITAEDLSKVYGEADPQFGISAAVSETDGSASTVTVSEPDASGQYTAAVTKADGTTAAITFTVSRIEGEGVGSYAITPAGVNRQAGYRVLFVPGTLTIEPAHVTVRAGAEKVYGESDPESLVTLFLNDEPVAELAGITYIATREEGEDAGDYPITLSGEATQGNYAVTFESGELTITRASATVTAMNKAKTYGEDDPEFTATVTGLRNDDSEEVIAYDLGRNEGENVGNYTISPTGAEVQGNYTVSFTSGTLTIDRAALTIAVADAEKVYGTEDPDWEIVINGLIGDDAGGTLTVAVDGRSYTYKKSEDDAKPLFAFEVTRGTGENVGDYAITPSGDTAQGNYTVNFTRGTLTILRAELTVRADEIVKAVGVADDPLLTAKVTGWANGDDSESVAGYAVSESGVTWTYTRNGDAILTFTLTRESGDEEGDYEITASGADEQSNYTVIYESGTFKILSKFDVIVTQTVLDPVDAMANPTYSYKATVDLTDSGLSGSYNDNGFVNGVQTFTLPDQTGGIRKELIIPAGATVTIEQTTENPDYITEVTQDGKATGSENKWEIASLDDHYYLGFIHTRIGLSIRAMTTAEGTETVVSGSAGYMGIPDEAQSVDAMFAEDFQNRVGYALPSDKYYSYDHASLYSADGEAISGASGISAIRYDKESATWQYSVDGASYADAPSNAQLTLFYIPKYICKIGNEKFYTLNAAMDYVAAQATHTATIEMLISEYVMPASDKVTVPAGYEITITTATEGYEGSADTAAVIRRSAAFASAAMFTNGGTLTLDNITLDGNGGKVKAGHAMVVNGPDASALTVGEGATLQNASGNEGGAIYVNKTAVTTTIVGKLLNNAATKGGALFMANATGTVTFEEGSALEGNSATYGGAIYKQDAGTLNLGASVKNNSANYGGAVYMTGGTANVTGTMSENRATNGGAVYMTGGTATLSGAVSENSATNGGAVYMTSGTANVTGTISDNVATGSGGAYYIEGGTLSINAGTASNNNIATENGGMLYGTNGTVTISAGTFSGNKATGGNGGVICYGGAGTVTVKGGTFTGNSANYGGVVYQSAGTVTLSAGTMGGTDDVVANIAKNGSAVYATGGTTTLSGVIIQGNAASEGGAVGFGSASARVTFSGKTVVTGNTMGNVPCNVYLDIDSDQVINSTGLDGSANIGVYVTNDLRARHGDMGTNFGSCTFNSNSNVGKFVNDRSTVLKAWFYNYKLIWSAPITYNVRYISSFAGNNKFPPKTRAIKRRAIPPIIPIPPQTPSTISSPR